MSTVGFAEHLELVNQITGKRHKMRLKEDAPIESSKEVAPGDTGRVLEHTVSCGLEEAVAVLGLEVEAGRRLQGAKIRLVLDGEDVLKGVLEDASAATFSDFLPTQCLFMAEISAGAKVGIFMPNGTVINVIGRLKKDAKPASIRACLRTAVYTLMD